MVASAEKGIIRLDPWQQRAFDDPARVLVINWHRQAGKDFDAAAIAVDDGFARKGQWFIVSLTQRQADATFAKCRQVADIFKRVLKRRGEIVLEEREYVEYDREIDQEFRCTARTLRLPGGGSVTSLPGRDPDTLAGLTGNVIFTEFGLFPKGGTAHWRVIFPLITRGYRIIVISTPRGKNSKFYELCQDKATYSVHIQTIEDSVREGFVLRDNAGKPTTLEIFKRLYGDDVGWRREYMCEFCGDLEALIAWAKLELAGELTRANPGWHFNYARIDGESPFDPAFFSQFKDEKGRLEIGWDVARSGNLSSVWANLASPGAPKRLRYLVLMHNVMFTRQREILRAAMDSRPGNVGCGDATGLGADSNETLATLYRDRWKPVVFTARSKSDLASRLSTAYGDGGQALPDIRGEHKFIHTDLYALQADRSGGNVRIEEGANPLLPESHLDIAFSNGLALEAGLLAPNMAWLDCG